MYTDEEDIPLRQVFKSIQTKENGSKIAMDVKKAGNEELRAYLQEVLPNFDRDRVHTSDIRKLVQWYNLLVDNGLTDFEEPAENTEDVATEK